MNKIKFTLLRLGIDKDVAWILFNRFSMLLNGPILLIFILLYLDEIEQGYWFVFGSLSAISVLAELGFTRIITQFVSHEFSHLEINKGFIRGQYKQIDRLISLIRYSFRVYLVIIPVAFIIVWTWGLYILNDAPTEIIISWSFFAIVSSIKLLLSLFQAIYQGLDKVSDVYRSLTAGVWIMQTSSWILLILGFGIWTLVISSFSSIIYMALQLYMSSPRFWSQVRRHKQHQDYRWFDEIIILQGKYAVSWVSGYLVFHLFVPFALKYHGPEVAGQLGMTIALLKSLMSISSSWVESKIPKLNMFVAKNEHEKLVSLFKKSAYQGYISYLVGAIVLCSLVYISVKFEIYNDRILSFNNLVLLLLSDLAMVKISFMAVFLRAHKEEPYYILSLVNGLLVAGTIYVLLPISLTHQFTALVGIYWLILLPWAYYIYACKSVKYKKLKS